MVPVDDTVLVMVPVETVWTVVVVVISGAALELVVASQVPTPAAAATTTTAPTIVPLRLNHFLRSATTCASLVFVHRGHRVHRSQTTRVDGRPQVAQPSNRLNIYARKQSPVSFLRMRSSPKVQFSRDVGSDHQPSDCPIEAWGIPHPRSHR
jgi:hypothetical protein